MNEDDISRKSTIVPTKNPDIVMTWANKLSKEVSTVGPHLSVRFSKDLIEGEYKVRTWELDEKVWWSSGAEERQRHPFGKDEDIQGFHSARRCAKSVAT